MKLKLVAAAVAALGLSVGAYADDTFVLGTVTGTVPIGNTVSGSFTDTFTFDVAGPSMTTAIAVSTHYVILPSGPDLFKISGFAATLDGFVLTHDVVHTTIGPIDVVTESLFTFLPVPMFAAGNPHELTIHGVAGSPLGAYSGTLTVTPVPEPETYALMLAGLGALGFLARRRQPG